MRGRMETRFELMTICSNTIINYKLSQKYKLYEKREILIIYHYFNKSRYIAHSAEQLVPN